MKNSMQLMTIDDINGHWKSKDGLCYVVINKAENRVQLFENHKLIISEPLSFQYIQEKNDFMISKSITLWMIQPLDSSIYLKYNDKIVDFNR